MGGKSTDLFNLYKLNNEIESDFFPINMKMKALDKKEIRFTYRRLYDSPQIFSSCKYHLQNISRLALIVLKY